MNSLQRFHRGWFLLALVVSLASAKADPLDNWTAGQVNTNLVGGAVYGSQFLGVAYGAGRYVAVGQYASDDNATIQTSEDGVNWTLRTKGDYSILDLFDVTYANGIFLAGGWDYFGGQNIYTSTNGIDWAPHHTAMTHVYGIAFGQGTYVAVGDGVELNSSTVSSNNVYFSIDGTNWTATDSGVPASATTTLSDVAYGNNQFVAVGGGYIYPLFNHSRITNSLTGGSVSFCNGRFFIPGGPGTNLVSTDGVNWSILTNNVGASLGRVVYSAGVYIALSGTNIFSSVDGTNWLLRNFQGPSNVTLKGLAAGARNIVATGYVLAAGPKVVPVAYVSDPFVSLNAGLNFPPQLNISGLTGRTYQVEVSTNFSANWQVLTNLALTNGPIVWTDLQATNDSRFYRAELLP